MYRSELRQRQAAATRSRILAAAAELFAAEGYARATLPQNAAAAAVSAGTAQGQGPKAALLIAAIEYAAFGVTGEDDVRNLDVGRTLLAIDDRDEALRFLVTAVTDLHQRTAQLAQALIAGATADPELERYLADLQADIKRQTRRVLEEFRGRGWLRGDVGFDDVVETSTVLCSVDVYLRVTVHDSWSPDTYQAWCRRMLAETVFGRGPTG